MEKNYFTIQEIASILTKRYFAEPQNVVAALERHLGIKNIPAGLIERAFDASAEIIKKTYPSSTQKILLATSSIDKKEVLQMLNNSGHCYYNFFKKEFPIANPKLKNDPMLNENEQEKFVYLPEVAETVKTRELKTSINARTREEFLPFS